MSAPTTPERDQQQAATRRALSMHPGFAKAAAALALYETGSQAWSKVKAWHEKHTSYQVSIEEGDSLFADVQDWLLSIVPEREHKQVKVLTSRDGYGSSEDFAPIPAAKDGDEGRPAPMRVVIDDDTNHRLWVDGHRVVVTITKPANAAEGKSAWRAPQKITFRAYTPEGQQAVLDQVKRLRKDRGQRKPSLSMTTSWGSWQRRNDIPVRTLESVFLPPEQKERIVDDVGDFLAAEEKYVRLGMPYHRGYMFHGPPGTGKTSLIKAIANHYRLDLFYMPLADLRDESGLVNLISDVRPRSLLLLEDVDTLPFARGEGGESGITIGSLLNALDGVSTPHGLITAMTTNNFDKLDSRLVRAGRMDRVEKIDVPTRDEIAEMFRYFYGTEPERVPYTYGITQATVAEIFKRHIDDRDGAVADLINHVVEIDPEALLTDREKEYL